MRSKDRLAELKDVAEQGGVYHSTVERADLPEKTADLAHIQALFDDVDRIRRWIHDINGNTQLLRRLHSDPTFHTNRNLQAQLDAVITQSHATGLKVCGALRQLEGLTGAGGGGGGSVVSRLARLQYAASRQLYAEALAAHEAALQAVRTNQCHLLQEQIRLTNLSISDDECQSLLESKNISLFVDNLEAETQEARLALRDVEARHQELLKIEDSIREVHELFVQMSHLVAHQQDLVDTVEYYASQATVHVEYGGQQLLKGTVSRRKARNKKISLIICMVSGFLLVLLILIVT